ncbi:MAG: M14 family zinc carboxypeptidase, partial [Chloroflexia bacterium]
MRNRHRSSPLFRAFLLPFMASLVLVTNGSSGPANAQAPISKVASANSVLVLRLYYSSRPEYGMLAAEFGLEQSYSDGGYLSLQADQATLDDLKARGKHVEIDQAATKQAIENPAVFGHNADNFFNGYYTVEEMQAFLDQKVAQYPTLAQKVDFGDSWCKTHPTQCTQPNSYSGYDMLAMRITNQNIAGSKPVFWFNTGLHAREIVPPELGIRYISWLLDNYNTNADARWLVDWNEIWIVPMSNPDGHHITESGTPTPRTQRKNANNTNGCTTYPPSGSSQFGTDLNRNFEFKWNCCGGSSGSPCALTYRGPSPASEPETQAITSKRAELIADQRGPGDNDPAPITTTGVFLDMHSNASLTLYPWGQTTAHAPNNDDLRNIAKHMAAPSVGGNGYRMEQSVGLYPTDGASDDAAYGDLGAAAFTVELDGSSFTPAYSAVESMWNNNRGMLIHLSKIARTPYLTTRGPDSNTVASTPMTVTQGTPAALTASMNYNWSSNNPVEVNTYIQNVAAAEYYVDTPPWAGGTGIAMAASDGSFNSPTEGTQATVDTSSLTPGRHIIMVRGRGVNDYSGFQSWGAISAAFLDVLPNGGPTSTPTNTAVVPPTSTNTVVVATSTSTALSTNTSTSTRTNTAVSTNTATAVSTSTSTATNTPVVPTQTPGGATATTAPTNTSTNTPGPATATSTSQATATLGGPTVTATATACTIQFADVLPGNTFYANVRCLACRGIINGYPCGGDNEPCNGTNDPYFRPSNNISRGQLAKVVSLSAGFNEPVTGQSFEDVAPGTTFYDYV